MEDGVASPLDHAFVVVVVVVWSKRPARREAGVVSVSSAGNKDTRGIRGGSPQAMEVQDRKNNGSNVAEL